MLEEPKIKKVDKRDKQLPQNFEQLIEMYDIEKIWPFILKTIQFINKEIPEDFKELIEKYELEDILKFFNSASKIMDFNASGKGMAIGKVSEENSLEVALSSIFTKNVQRENSTPNTDTYFRAIRTDTGTEVYFGVGSGGVNHGVWSEVLGKWLLYSDGTNVYVNGYKINEASTRDIQTLYTKGCGEWTDQTDGNHHLITKAFMAWWNGAYNSAGASNLTFCHEGTIVGKNSEGTVTVTNLKIANSGIEAVTSATDGNTYFGSGSGYSGKITNLRGNTVRLYAHTSGAVYLGYSGSTAVTSDENLKDIYEIDDKYIEFFNNLKPITYVYKDKGHRNHMGFGARQVEEALTKAGLTTEQFAGVLKDNNVTISADEMGTEEDVHFDELYSLRYEEFIALNTMMIQKQAKQIEEQNKTIEDLKARIEKLEIQAGVC